MTTERLSPKGVSVMPDEDESVPVESCLPCSSRRRWMASEPSERGDCRAAAAGAEAADSRGTKRCSFLHSAPVSGATLFSVSGILMRKALRRRERRYRTAKKLLPNFMRSKRMPSEGCSDATKFYMGLG